MVVNAVLSAVILKDPCEGSSASSSSESLSESLLVSCSQHSPHSSLLTSHVSVCVDCVFSGRGSITGSATGVVSSLSMVSAEVLSSLVSPFSAELVVLGHRYELILFIFLKSLS